MHNIWSTGALSRGSATHDGAFAPAAGRLLLSLSFEYIAGAARLMLSVQAVNQPCPPARPPIGRGVIHCLPASPETAAAMPSHLIVIFLGLSKLGVPQKWQTLWLVCPDSCGL